MWLTWKTFGNKLTKTFRNLFNEQRFADVTLVSDDQQEYKAHKVVLSACSPVLGNILLNNQHSHPLIYLKGFKSTELQKLLEFMYLGETSVNQNSIDQFVKVARELDLEEFKDDDGNTQYDAVAKYREETVNVVTSDVIENVFILKEEVDNDNNDGQVGQNESFKNPYNPNTNKGTNWAIRIYDETMLAEAETGGTSFVSFEKTLVDMLPSKLCKFFSILKKPDGSSYRKRTFETIYHNISRAVDRVFGVLMKRNENFLCVTEVVKRQIKSIDENHSQRKYNAMPTEKEIRLAFAAGELGRSSSLALLTAAFHALVQHCGLKSFASAYSLTNGDLTAGPLDPDLGLPQFYQLRDKANTRALIDRENPECCPVRTIFEYQERKTATQRSVNIPFFLSAKSGATESERFWYLDNRVGRNSIRNLMIKTVTAETRPLLNKGIK